MSLAAALSTAPLARRELRWRSVRKLLAIRLDALDRVLMTTPALAALRCETPDLRLTLLTTPDGSAAEPHLGMLDELLTFRAPWLADTSADLDERVIASEQALIAALAERRFDAAIVFTSCGQSALPAALLCKLAGIPLRLAQCAENPHELLSDWLPEPACTDGNGDGDPRHEVQRQLDLVAAAGYRGGDERLQFQWQPTETLAMRRKFGIVGGDLRRPYIVAHPGAAGGYPADELGRAAAQLAVATGCQIVFAGGPEELERVVQARRAMREVDSISLAGCLHLGELAALLAGAQALICDLGGPAQLAAATGTPLVLLEPADPEPRRHPWKVGLHALAVNGAMPSAIVEAALALMGPPPAVPLPAPAWAA